MGINLQRFAAVATFVVSLLHLWFWEFIRAVIYEKVWHMLSQYVTADGLLHYGLTLTLAGLGAWLFWHTRPKQGQPRAIPEGLEWLSSYNVFSLADPSILADHTTAKKELESIRLQFAELHKRWLGTFDTDDEKKVETERAELAKVDKSKQQAADHLWTVGWEDVRQKLCSGELLAKGFKKPVMQNPDPVLIPSEYWRFLRFTDSFAAAQGEGISYTGVVVARAK